MYRGQNRTTGQPLKGTIFRLNDREGFLVSSLPPFKDATPQPLRIRTGLPVYDRGSRAFGLIPHRTALRIDQTSTIAGVDSLQRQDRLPRVTGDQAQGIRGHHTLLAEVPLTPKVWSNTLLLV
jgi:hypothetical protein